MFEDQAVGHNVWMQIERAESEAMLQAWCGWGAPEHAPKGSSRVAGFRWPSALGSRLLSVPAKVFARSR